MDITNLSLNILDPAKEAEKNLYASTSYFVHRDFNFHHLEADKGLGEILLYIHNNPSTRAYKMFEMLDLEPICNTEFITLAINARLIKRYLGINSPWKKEPKGLYITDLGIQVLRQNGLLP